MASKRQLPKDAVHKRFLPPGPCDFCGVEGPLRAVKRGKGEANYYCIPCHVDGNAA
jgi:hypothetical protein